MTNPTKLRRPATLDHLRSKPLPQRVIEIHLDDEAIRDVERCEAELERCEAESKRLAREADAKEGQRARSGDQAKARKATEDARKALDVAKQMVEESTVEMLLRAVGRKRYDALIIAHPATDEQNAESMEELDRPAPYNTDTFPVALVAASLVEPNLTESEVGELFENWTTGEIQRLWLVALEVNSRSELVGLGKASPGTRG